MQGLHLFHIEGRLHGGKGRHLSAIVSRRGWAVSRLQLKRTGGGLNFIKEVNMKRKFVKLVSVVTLLAAVFSLCVPALAADPQAHVCTHSCGAATQKNEDASVTASCITHTWGPSQSTLVKGAGIYRTTQTCDSYWKETRTCTKCGRVEVVRYYYTVSDKHTNYKNIYRASCDGTTQTWIWKCNSCLKDGFNSTYRCPAGPHRGGCPALPV